VEWLGASDHALASDVLLRLLGLCYLLAFVNVLHQFPALLGERGLSPVPRFVQRVAFRRSPSLFHWHYSDRLLRGVGLVGVTLASLVVVGVVSRWPLWASVIAWATLWALYLSVVNVGQTFYAFGWETLLLEAGFLAITLGPSRIAPPVATLWLVRWLLFRVEFGAGLIKLRGDPCWRDLSCLDYHHETQPLPNRLSWRFHHLPGSVHRIEVAANHVVQLVVPFGLFLPQPFAGSAASLIIVTQAWLLLSGNFAWLNLLTITLAVAALPDAWLAVVLPEPAVTTAPSVPHGLGVLAVTALVVVLSWRPVRNLGSASQRMNASFDPLRLVNTYGAFGSITRHRREIVIEATADTPGPDARWEAYELPAKPGDPRRRPRQVAPYHLRLDWLLWFVGLSSIRAHPWFEALVRALLRADPTILRLFAHDPFAGRAPRALRVRRFHYRFSTPAERRETGAWWIREPEAEELPPVMLGPDGQLTAAR
jgi:hypothetical protein